MRGAQRARDRLGQRRRAGGAGRAGRRLAVRRRHRGGGRSPRAALLLGELGHGGSAELHRGDMWQPVAGRRFDLIVANLPHFPDGARPTSPAACRPGAPAAPTAAGCSIPSSTASPTISRRAAAPSSRTTPSSVSSARATSLPRNGLSLRDRPHDAGLYPGREARAHDRRRAARRGRAHDPPLRSLYLRRDAHRRDRRGRDAEADDAGAWRLCCSALLRRLRSPLAAPAVAAAETPDAALAEAARGCRPRRGARRLRAAQRRPAGPHPLRRPHPHRRARVLSAVRHARGRDAAAATRSTWRAPSPGSWASRSTSSASMPRPASRCSPRIASTSSIATMGHNTQRDGQVALHPAALLSVGDDAGRARARSTSQDWPDIAGRTVCVTIGNGSNAEIVSHNARLMLFDEAGVLPGPAQGRDLHAGGPGRQLLRLLLHRSGLRRALRAEVRLRPGAVGHGGGARAGSDRLARALDLISQIFHRDGVFLEIAPRQSHRHRLPRDAAGGLAAAASATPTPAAPTPPACCRALNADLQPTPFAGRRRGVRELGRADDRHRPVAADAEDGAGLVDVPERHRQLADPDRRRAGGDPGLRRWCWAPRRARARRCCAGRRARITVTLQSSPIVLTLVIAAAIAHALFPYSAAVALGAAIVALGLINGSNAGQAISEAMHSLRAERGAAGAGRDRRRCSSRRSAARRRRSWRS